MPNPPKKTALSRKEYRKQRREQELQGQKEALYENPTKQGSDENAELIKRAIRWDLDKKFKSGDRQLSAREIALLATVKGMSHEDANLAAKHVTNLLRMEAMNQKDELGNDESGDKHLHLHTNEDGKALLERFQQALKEYEEPE